MSKKKELGKGIRALLTSMEDLGEAEQSTVSRALSRNVASIPLGWIQANPEQPRKDFDDEAIENLVQSIRVHGVIQPLTLRRLSDDAYQIIAGERRFRAAKRAGLEEVPAYVRIADDQALLEMALVENIQREDLNALEVAFSLNRLIAECDLTHDQLSERLGKNRSTVTNYLRLLKLPPEIQKAVREKRLSMGHARALAGVESLANQIALFRRTIAEELSVRKLEQLIRIGASTKRGATAPTLDPQIREIQDNLSGVFGSRVTIKRSAKGQGSITIHFTDDNSFNQILDTLNSQD